MKNLVTQPLEGKEPPLIVSSGLSAVIEDGINQPIANGLKKPNDRQSNIHSQAVLSITSKEFETATVTPINHAAGMGPLYDRSIE